MKICLTATPDIPKIMRTCVVQAMIILTLCGVATAHTNFAQLLERKVTLTASDVPLKNVLVAIEEQTSVKFFYSQEHVDVTTLVSLHVEKTSLNIVFAELFPPLSIRYKVHEKSGTVTLRYEKNQTGKADEPSYRNIPADKRALISGTVTDAQSATAMPGVNIIIKGTATGTTTDADGAYSINADSDDILVFTFIGYAPVETTVGSRTQIDIQMAEDIQSLKEVVINAGYYTTTKEQQTGNIARIEASDIGKQPVSNPLASMQGRMAGVEIIQQNGIPGGNFRVRIRGTNSIASGNDPLYIIDGVPFTSRSMSFNESSGNLLGSPSAGQGSSPLNALNPSDIESIEVLKDADATAIYGSRGANGVVLISTKKGSPGKVSVDVNFYSGISRVGRMVDMLSTSRHLEMRKQAFAQDNITMDAANAFDILVWDTTRHTNWQKKFIGNNAPVNDAQISISGGEKNTRFFAGAGYRREGTVFPGNNYDQRISLRSSLSNTSLNEKLKTNFSWTYTVNESDLPGEDLTHAALRLPPNAPPLYDDRGDLNWDGWSYFENPLALITRRFESATTNFLSSLDINYSITKDLFFKVNVGSTVLNNKSVLLNPLSSINPEYIPFNMNISIFSESNFRNWIAEPQISWRMRGQSSSFELMVGSTFLDQKEEGLAQYAGGFASESLMRNIASAPMIFSATNYYSQYRYAAVFGRLNYSIKNKYLINLTGRRDGSSRFGPGNQFANFLAAGGAWVFSEEKKIRDALRFITFGKLRGSYGTTGSDQIGDYQFLDSYSSAGLYGDVVPLTPVRLYNPSFGWEKTRKIEVALELSILDDVAFLSTSWYQNRSSNQLLQTPLPPTAGFPSVQSNLPATVQNKGFEFEFRTQLLSKPELSWTASINATFPSNKLIRFDNLHLSPEYRNRYQVGEPLMIRKVYKYSGVDPVTGLYTIEDVNQDGVYNAEDRSVVKYLGPDLYGGLHNTISYKRLQLAFVFQFVKQHGYDYYRIFGNTPGTPHGQPAFLGPGWTHDAPSAAVQRYSTGGEASTAYNRFAESDGASTDVSFIRLKNISLEYSLPTRYASAIHLRHARIYLQCQNLVTFTRYRGFDPETQNAALPPLQAITAGVNLSF